MPYGTLFQSNPTPSASSAFTPDTQASANDSNDSNPDASAATKLAEAIDDFLGDLENKFKGISDDILTKLDDMAERCDRLEAELLMKEAVSTEDATKGRSEGNVS